MLIILPSFKRTDILPWVIKSVLRCDVSDIPERKQILIVNNYYPNREIVDSIVEKFSYNDNFMCTALHRKETMPGIDSWFSAIAEYAAEDEVIFLLGDDDLMLPWGLRDRHREILKSKTDMLLSDFADRIYFFDKGQKYWMSSPFPTEDQQEKCARQWEFFPAKHPEASFMSNHCYRNTYSFRKGLDLAFSWCNSQSWLERGVRTGMLPFYLPYAISNSGGSVASLQSKCVFRGAVVDEAIKSSFADGGNVAFYELCAYDVFFNRALQRGDEKLAGVCARFKPGIFRGFITILVHKQISFQTLATTFKHAGLRFTDLLCVDFSQGALTVCINLLGLRGARLKLKRRSKSLLTTEQLFKSF